MTDTLVSVIIPAFNGEAHIKASAESILTQTYKKLELIIVNDGSSDNTKALCDEIKESDSRVTVINQNNEGVAKARNRGIEAASGDYIFFLDCDDYLERAAIEIMLAAAIENNADIVSCTLEIIKNGKVYPAKSTLTGLFEGERLQELYKMACTGKPNEAITMVTKLYRTSLIRESNLRLPPLVSGEDAIFSFDCMACAARIFFLDNAPFYKYVMNEGSFSHINFSIKKRTAQSDLFYDTLRSIINKHFGEGDFEKELIQCLSLRCAVSVFSFAALVESSSCAKAKKLSDLEFIAENENYKCALLPEVYKQFPLHYRLVLRRLGKKSYKSALFLLMIIRKLKGD